MNETKKLEKMIREQQNHGRLCMFFRECKEFDTSLKECVKGNYKFCEHYYEFTGEYLHGRK